MIVFVGVGDGVHTVSWARVKREYDRKQSLCAMKMMMMMMMVECICVLGTNGVYDETSTSTENEIHLILNNYQ